MHVRRGTIKSNDSCLSLKSAQNNLQERRFVDVYSPKGKRKIRIEHKKNQIIKIESNLLKRMELEYIEEAIEKMTVIPDFGYDIHMNENLSEEVFDEEAQSKGWQLFY